MNTNNVKLNPNYFIDSPSAWWRLIAALGVSTIGGIGLWSAVVVIPAIELEFLVDRSNSSTPYTMTMIGFAIGSVIMGKLVDRFGVFLPLIFSSLFLSFGYFTASIASSLWEFTVIQALLIGMLGSSITLGPLIADTSLWFSKRRGVAVSIVASGNYLAGALWPPILQFLIDETGWRNAHVIVGGMCILTMIPLAFALKARAPKVTEPIIKSFTPKTNNMKFSPKRTQISLIIAGVCCCVAMSMPQVHIVSYCGELGFGAARGAEMLAVMLGAGVVSRIISGAVADRIGGLMTLMIGSVLQCMVLLLYLPFSSLVPLYIISAFFGLAQGGLIPSYALIVRDYFPANEAASRVSVVMMATIFGMAIGGWLSGEIFDLTGSYKAAFINGIIFNLINMAIVFRLLLFRRNLKLLNTS